jgi:hypothetical protein
VWPDFLASDFKFILGFRNPPTADKIGPFDCSFGCAQGKVCFGFVFLISPSVHFHIYTYYKRAYGNLSVLDFGFVLHKKADL